VAKRSLALDEKRNALERLSWGARLALYVHTMPAWVTTLIGAVLGFAAAFVPVQMNIRNARTTRSQDTVSQLLGRMFAVSDAIQYSLRAAETRAGKASIDHAVWLSGELPEQVGRSLLLLPKADARRYAQDVSDKLRLAAMSLESYGKAAEEHQASILREARQTYDAAHDALDKLREALAA